VYRLCTLSIASRAWRRRIIIIRRNRVSHAHPLNREDLAHRIARSLLAEQAVERR
jgi:hypothetical protein